MYVIFYRSVYFFVILPQTVPREDPVTRGWKLAANVAYPVLKVESREYLYLPGICLHPPCLVWNFSTSKM